ncbi:MAG: DNA repair protein RecN [Pseudomonadales bacterium]
MLTHLLVKDVALVDHLELTLEAGMSVITGETGAGKSIMLDALGLALGDRAESGLIAKGADKAEIHASFDISGNESARRWLQSRELDHADGECILRRIVTKDGRSRGFINGAPVTVGDLKSLGDMLIDIHSQHEHQSLLKKDTHRRLLDEFGKQTALALKVEELSERYHSNRRALEALIATNDEQSSRLQLLSYQAEELAILNTTTEEAGILESEQKLLANAESILGACSEATTLLFEGENDNALALISRALQLVSSIDHDRIGPIVEMLDSSRIQLQEAVSDLTRFGDDVELDPKRLEEVETRLTEIYDLARKHRISPTEIPALQERISSELQQLGNADAEIERLQSETEGVRAEYTAAADTLSRGRAKASRQLKESVRTQLTDLGMQGAVFDIALTGREIPGPNPRGHEDVEFLISTNPGAAPRPLNRIASGGELSRISLAIDVVTADTSNVPTLVFDEVDAGIGGATAEVVGSLLRELGTKAQIICVTHLAQVAAQGHQHFLVTKSSDKNSAQTRISLLRAKDRVTEIARMLGGLEVTEQSLAHAKEMYQTAQR